MPRIKMVWLILEVLSYLAIFYLVLDFVDVVIDQYKENYASTIEQVTLSMTLV